MRERERQRATAREPRPGLTGSAIEPRSGLTDDSATEPPFGLSDGSVGGPLPGSYDGSVSGARSGLSEGPVSGAAPGSVGDLADGSERGRLLVDGERLRAEARSLPAADAAALWREFDKLTERYRDLLPEVPVARCPFTDAPVCWPIDTAGLDGWFWEYPVPVRRRPRDLPPSWLAMTGAMALAGPVEHTPFPVVPGPGVPFVAPRVLGAAPQVRGVISQVTVGRHTGWAISYFGWPKPGTRLVNLWGMGSYPVVEDGLWTSWVREESGVERYDFDLEPWVGTGALLWIAPGDESATLREGVDNCPYLGPRPPSGGHRLRGGGAAAPGARRLAVVERGQVRHVERLD